MNTRQKIVFAALIILTLVVFLFGLGSLPLYDYDEAHYGQVVHDTIRSDSYLTLTRFGADWIDKPPLLFWLTMGSVTLFGENEFAMRLPTALFGIAAIWGVYILTLYLTKNVWTALAAGGILLLSGIFPAAGRQLRLDVPLATTMVFSLYSFIRAWERPRWHLGFWIFTAFGILTRSFPALLIGPVILIFSAVYKKWHWLKNKFFWLGALLFGAITAPWHIYETFKFGTTFWDTFLIRHIFTRTADTILGGNVTNVDYLKHFLVLNEPWFFLFIILILLLLVYRHNKESDGWKLTIAALLSSIFLALPFLIAKTKLVFYLIPLFPFEALALAGGGLWFYHKTVLRRKKEIFTTLCILAFGGGIASTAHQIFISNIPYSYPHVYDEKAIGEIVKKHDNNHTLYAFDWKAYDTIYYYSDKPYIALVEREDLQKGFPPPYFMIVPRPYLQNKNQPGLRLLYEGKYLVLLEGLSPKTKE